MLTLDRHGQLPLIGLGALFASLLHGCCTNSTCGCEGGPYTSNVTTQVSGDDLDLLEDGEVTEQDCETLCDDGTVESVIACTDLGPTQQFPPSDGSEARDVACVVEKIGYCEGRRHAAIDSDVSGRGPTPIAAWLARAASAEAASVHSFIALAEELQGLDAPASLVNTARASAADEARHAKVMTELASRAGALAPRRRATRNEETARSLVDLALENAVEGCVNETFAALMAMHQARHASDPALRRGMQTIATDELRHAELAWEIHKWACAELGTNDISRIHAAMGVAASRLRESLAGDELGLEARQTLGLPPPNEAVALANAVTVQLWS